MGGNASTTESATKYAAAYTARSPNSADFRKRYADPQPDEVLQTLRNRVEEMEQYEDLYSTNIDVFRTQAEIDRREKTGLLSNVQKLRAQLVAVEETREAGESEKSKELQRRDEDCNRKILHMRKSLLLSEQSVGSLRSENEELAAKAAALDIQREECETLRRQIFQMNQNMTLLAQQNEQLQRALKRKEADVQADLDVYVKQLDVVQAQSATSKREMEVMSIKLRAQETLQQEIDSLRQQNLDLQGAINDVDKEASDLQAKHVMELQEKDDECAREVLNFRREVMALEKQVESLSLQNQHLVNKHRPQQITDEINRLTTQVQSLSDELDQKTRQNEAMQRALARKDQEREADVSELTDALRVAQDKINTLVGDLHSEQLIKGRQAKEITELKEKIDSLRLERDGIEADMHSKTRELQCQLDAISHRANTNQNEAETLKALATSMEEKHRVAVEVQRANHQSELRDALKAKDNQYAEAISDHVNQLEISSRLTASVRQQNAELSEEVAKLSGDAAQTEPLRAKIAQLEALLAHREEEASNDLQTFNSQADGLTRELNAVRAERDESRSELYDLRAQVDDLRKESDTIPTLEQELESVREKVIDMNAQAIKTEKTHAAHIEELQNQLAVYERQMNESIRSNSTTRELEFAVKNRQLASENERLRDIIRQYVPDAPLGTPDKVLAADTPSQFASPLVSPNLQQQQQQQQQFQQPLQQSASNNSLTRARSVPQQQDDAVSDNGERAAPPAPVPQQPRVPPLELSKALQGNSPAPRPTSPVQFLGRGASMYEGSVVSDEAGYHPSGGNHRGSAPRAGSEETVDSLMIGRPIAYGTQPQNSLQFETIPRLFERTAHALGDSVAIRYEKRPSEWEEVTWRQYYLRSFNFAKALSAEDMKPFQGVVICAANSPEWMTAFCGTIFCGGLPVACHPSWGPRHFFRIASECNAHVIVVDSGKSLQKFLAIKDQLPSVKHIVLFREAVPPALKSLHGDFILSLDQFLARANHATDESIALRGDKIEVEHAAAILYTSGTLEEPKGVVLSHDNLCFTAHSVMQSYFQEQNMPTLISFALHGEAQGAILDIVLPMLYVTNRQSPLAICIPKTGTASNLAATLRAGKPTVIAGTPALLAEVAQLVTAAPKSEGDAKLAAWASKVSLEASRNRQELSDITQIKGLSMASQVNERIRATIGLDRCTVVIGLGPIPVNVSEALAQAGIDVLEAYGSTETTGFATVSTTFHYRFGTSGVRLPGTELRVEPEEGLPASTKDGQILVRGRNVMLGYVGNDSVAKNAVDADNWMHTGDVGRVDELNLVTVTGRSKELFTALNGDKVSPSVIENELKRQCQALSNVVVVGDRRKYVVALVTLKCKKNAETGAWTDELDGDALSVNPDVLTVTTARRDKQWLEYISHVVSVYNSHAPSSVYKVRRFCILSSDISAEEMTPTKKIKRRLVTDRCINIIEKLYAEESPRSGK
ncbi:long-chain-fatty-acid-CoA ligase, putative [Bodo saltans]|uniref:Long-chain-fatty-acid-CoA ligase, putative n=1 Tax=Bodo saltans TaxID=75058 RepID=A0A0S4JJP9_BODSA|nr:long-chain-fatty-acid-CoA ligase, putative [Bodo saltans]|eukprot:CUG90319.1 long-chain-fatty-acid-CoA ligase, putative [Bodo saltans]